MYHKVKPAAQAEIPDLSAEISTMDTTKALSLFTSLIVNVETVGNGSNYSVLLNFISI